MEAFDVETGSGGCISLRRVSRRKDPSSCSHRARNVKSIQGSEAVSQAKLFDETESALKLGRTERVHQQ